MNRRVTLPPQETLAFGDPQPAGWWHDAEDGSRIACDLCPRGCMLRPGDRGFCFVRENQGGRMISTTYGHSTGFCVDPIEKKPLNQFYPGAAVLSFGTPGCNLGCNFCQNWTMTRSRSLEAACQRASPEKIAAAAKQIGCRSVAFTYNDPIIWAEYAIDAAKACHAVDVKTVAVTSGYITDLARPAFFEHIDAANVDLKGFTDDFYRHYCGGKLQPVLDTLRWIAKESRVWLEITNLLIPQANDAPREIEAMCRWIAAELGPEVPLHFSAFHPDFKLTDRGPTPTSLLLLATDLAHKAGLRYVYTGNVIDREHQHTYCPGCKQMIIERNGYELGAYRIVAGCCAYCKTPIAGCFDAEPGQWGSRRMPIQIDGM
jgi:AmmeMemoRadiSam system radical SAM enzyme